MARSTTRRSAAPWLIRSPSDQAAGEHDARDRRRLAAPPLPIRQALIGRTRSTSAHSTAHARPSPERATRINGADLLTAMTQAKSSARRSAAFAVEMTSVIAGLTESTGGCLLIVGGVITAVVLLFPWDSVALAVQRSRVLDA